MLKFIFVLAFSVHAFAYSPAINPKFEELLPTESQDVQNIERGILFLQQQNAAANGGKALRGTHAKGVCLKGELEVTDLSATPHLKMGMFSEPAKYPTTIRFANADGQILPDQEPDVRAVSLAVEVPPALSNSQGRMDFAFNNATTFPINDAHVFGNLMVIAEEGIFWGGLSVGPSGLLGVKRAIALGGEQKAPASISFQKMTYWSTVPFQLGAEQAVKYALVPCESNVSNELSSDPNTLFDELKRHVSEDAKSSCFNLQVQVLNEDAMTDQKGRKHSAVDWVENASWEWPADQAPFANVAKLTLTKGSILDDSSCEALKIDVTAHSNEIHRGLGSINRARSFGERSSAKNR